jgi:hypothetical protein
MDNKLQKAILDRAWSYSSENPYEDEEEYQPLSADYEREPFDMVMQVSIQRQINSC